MTRKQRRLMFVGLFVLALGTAAALTLTAFNDTMVYFYSPTDLKEKAVGPDRRVRVGGLVEQGSVQREGHVVRFVVTDMANTVPVAYSGILPDLFREGQGVVTEGRMGKDGTFQAQEVLAKHDENYMPKEVADSLKKSGYWQEGQGPQGQPQAGAAKQ